jgi:flagellin
MSVINTNVSSMQAQNSVRTQGLSLSTAMERLSSGIRINSAKDDAAGLAISTRMTASIRGISAAIRNANDGISLTQTAEGSMAQIGDNLQRIRELAVQSANSGNNSSDRAAMNNEATQLIAEIDRIASNTTYNGIKLLDGSYQKQNLQVGAGNDSNDRIEISIGNTKASALGVGSSSSYSSEIPVASATAAGSATALAAGGISINGYNVGAAANDGVSLNGVFTVTDGTTAGTHTVTALSSASGISIANAINAISGSTGVVATVNETSLDGTTITTAGYAVVIAAGSVNINGVSIGGVEAAASAAGRGNQIAAAINNVTSQTGVTATFNTTTGAVKLLATDGRNIVVDAYGLAAKDVTGLGSGPASGSTAGTAAVTAITTSKVSLSSTGSAGITVAGTAAGVTASGLTAGYRAATATAGAGVSSLDLTTATGSQAALSTLDSAINTVTDARAAMGAYQNRLTASISNLETTSMNLSASRSRILDTDYAKETTNLAKAQIIQQAATAMLAQANQSGQSVLALLK